MFSLTADIENYLDAPWDTYEPYFHDLNQRPIEWDNIHHWLLDWTRIHELIFEVGERLYVAYNQDTANQAAEKRHITYIEEINPRFMAAEQRLKLKLLESGLEPAGFEIPMRNLRTQSDLFREDNLPLRAEEQVLNSEYEKIRGSQSITWEGQELTIPQMQPIYQNAARDIRKQIWLLASQRQLEDQKIINDLWRKFMDVRGRIASNAGVSDYRAYMWKELLRFDYTPEDCMNFHHAIETIIVPAATRVYEKKRQKMGLDSLRPWDLDLEQGVATFYVPPLKPYQETADLAKITSRIFHRVDPQLGYYFEIMLEENLLDLPNRKGKAPGAYCTSYDFSKRPFVFMNAVGTRDDVQTLLHETGHAFHVFETNMLPYFQQRRTTEEFGEVASMAMELLPAPYLLASEGGFYSLKDYARAQIEQLESYLLFWPYMAVVDAFQHWVYTHHSIASEPAKCDHKWNELWAKFIPGVDWSGLEEACRTGWHRKIHIHTNPFYYVEYGMAQLGALQIWRNALQDQASAVNAYRTALSLGGTVTIPELYRAAGASFAFDVEIVEGVVDLVEKTISDLEDQGID